MSTESLSVADIREWDEARCPICMEHPHNAVLLQCSSSDKGCRAYMCDTSYRHSNCLDQFRKSTPGSGGDGEGSEVKPEIANLTCPLCRGEVKGWTVVEGARHYMNGKPRSCSLETCSFNGVYKELRKHARTEHPCLRPSEADPDRQRDWRRMERQRDIGDLLSGIRSALGMGDWELGPVADDNELASENVNSPAPSGPPTIYIIYQVLGVDRSEVRLFSRISTSIASRTEGRIRRRPLWGEIIEEESDLDEEWPPGHDPDENATEDATTEQVFHIRRRHPRARRNLHLSDEDEPL